MKELGINAAFYHAEVPQESRRQVQQDWMDDKTDVICATIAFGMGINKPDVRFVVHHSLPKSLEGYMQETGRAGRDGDRADCYLFYTYGDKSKIDSMICKSEGDESNKATQRLQLLQMVSYAEDEFECRRKLMLAYFNETFDASACQQTCDNCRSGVKVAPTDVTAQGQTVLQFLEHSHRMKLTLTMVVDCLKGSDTKVVKTRRLNEVNGYGGASGWKRTDIERLCHVGSRTHYHYSSHLTPSHLTPA